MMQLNIVKNKLLLNTLFGFAFLVNIFLFFWLYYFLQPTVEAVPLHYNIYFGIDRIGSGLTLYWRPFMGLVFGFLNYLVALFVYRYSKKSSYYLALLTIIFEIILLVAIFALYLNYY